MPTFGFVFPGQGSQKLGLLKELAADFPRVEATFAEASSALQMDLWSIAQYDNGNTLDQTQITQPVLLAAAVAIWRVWQDQGGPTPAILAGHSLGEYSALVCAGVLDFADAVHLVHQRGLFMQDAVPPGTGKMAAIVGLENDIINRICAEAAGDEVVSAANFNSAGQTVIAGTSAAVDRAIELCKENGAKRAIPLNVSVPSHCALMKPAADKLEIVLRETRFSPAQIPVVQNVNAQSAESVDAIRANLTMQLYQPVQWVDSVHTLYQSGARKLVECGPGKVLSGLIKRIEPDLACFGSDDSASLASAIAEMGA
jgi:[acyl-carrier-protein] S-malonyltransferase